MAREKHTPKPKVKTPRAYTALKHIHFGKEQKDQYPRGSVIPLTRKEMTEEEITRLLASEAIAPIYDVEDRVDPHPEDEMRDIGGEDDNGDGSEEE